MKDKSLNIINVYIYFNRIKSFLAFTLLIIPGFSLFCQTVTFDCAADSWIRTNTSCSSWQNTNYGSNIMMQCNSWTYSYLNCGSGNNRSLLKFDLEEEIPANMLYDNRAVLKLYFPDVNNQETQNYIGSANDNNFLIYIVTEDWDEYLVTWNNQPDVWGDDFILVPSTDIVPSFSDYFIDVSGLVEQWMCKLLPNYGLKLQLVTESYYRRVSFSTREYDNVANHPVLECQFASIEAQGPATSCGDFTLTGVLSNAEFPEAYHFEWTHVNSSTVFQGQDYVNPPTVPGLNTYVLTVTNDYCQTAADTVFVDFENIDYDISDSFTICNNGPQTIDLGIDEVEYLWSDGTSNQYLSVVNSGDYSVTITNYQGCEAIENFSVEFSDLSLAVTSQNVSCNGGDDGAIFANAFGGAPSYLFSINSEFSTVSGSFQNLAAGTYGIIVIDSINCFESALIEINEPNPINVTVAQIINQVCNAPGSAVLSVSGGVEPYTYYWPANSSGVTNNYATELFSGNYCVTVIDDNDCLKTIDFFVNSSPVLDVDVFVVDPFICSYDSIAVINAICSDGNYPFSFLWSDGNSFSLDTINQPGTYSVTVTDANLCAGIENISVHSPAEINCSAEILNVDCFGANTGSINVSASGGIPPYQYIWDSGSVSPYVCELTDGTYSLIVTDYNSCTNDFNYLITQPLFPLSLDFYVQNPYCSGDSNGNLKLFASGGYSPYSYSVTGNNYSHTGDTHEFLSEGEYFIAVTDSSGCSIDSSMFIVSPDELDAVVFIKNPTCHRFHDGSIELNVSGGTPPYSFVINDSIRYSVFFEGLEASAYTIQVYDAKNCMLLLEDLNLTDDPNMNCIEIPDAFTPNGDGINDIWIIENINLYPEALIQIFNRWGQELWRAKGLDAPWSGQYNNRYVPAGSYVYVVNLFNGIKPFVGIVIVVY